MPPISRRERFITDSEVYRRGFADGKKSASGEPLTLDEVRAMSPAQINARRPEVDDFMRSLGKKDGRS